MIFQWATRYVKHLEAEIVELREAVIHERQRAEMAINELLNVRVNVGPVTVPTPREVQQAEGTIEKLLRDSEFAQTGNAD